MNKRTLGYWATTALVALAFATGGIFDLLAPPAVIDGMHQLGYPTYFAAILGIWKVLGTLAITVPALPRLKEWAYAGMFFDLSGAAISHAVVGDAAGKVVTPLVLLGLVIASWALRPASRKLALTERVAVQPPKRPLVSDARLAV